MSVDLGNLNGGYDNAGTAGLLIGGSQYVPATGTDATSGNWTTWTAVFTGTPGTQGDSITIDLRAVIDVPPVQSDFDKVGLTASTATPEPGFYGLLALGLSGLVTVAARHHKKARA